MHAGPPRSIRVRKRGKGAGEVNPRAIGEDQVWCGSGDLNPDAPKSASPSSWCVCQFRHFRAEGRSKTKTRAYFAGVVAGAAGVDAGGVDVAGGVAGAADGVAAGAVDRGGVSGLAAGGGAGVPLTTDPVPRCPMIESASANSMKRTAATEVALVSSVAPERAPNAAWLLLPPNALAISPPRPCCRRITSESTKHTRT